MCIKRRGGVHREFHMLVFHVTPLEYPERVGPTPPPRRSTGLLLLKPLPCAVPDFESALPGLGRCLVSKIPCIESPWSLSQCLLVVELECYLIDGFRSKNYNWRVLLMGRARPIMLLSYYHAMMYSS